MSTRTKFKIYNGPMPTTAARAAVTTGTSIKTMLQVKSAAGVIKVLEWGVSCDGAAVAAGIEWELLTTAAIAATVTASVEADIIRWATRYADTVDGKLAASYLTLSTTGTGYTSSGEGTIAATKTFDSVFLTPTDVFVRKLDSPIIIPAADVLRIRCKAASAVNAICWILAEIAD